MQKLVLIGLVCLAMASHAAVNDALLTFSTKGPDTYADGVKVVDGECYALVWTKNGTEFKGFAANGEVVDSENSALVLLAPVAKNGRCPTVLFQIDAARAAAFTDGSYGVWLLDTRVVSADGKTIVSGGVDKNGKPALVNGFGSVADGIALSEKGSLKTSAVDEEKVAGSVAALPSNVAQPKIKAIRIVGDNVHLTVENLPGFMRVQGSSDMASFDKTGAAQATDGVTEDVILVTPKGSSNQSFFKVIRN